MTSSSKETWDQAKSKAREDWEATKDKTGEVRLLAVSLAALLLIVVEPQV